MITELKIDHWYRWVGEKKRPGGFNSSGDMDFLMDGKPHKNLGAGCFADDPSNVEWCWTDAYPYLEELPPLTTKEWATPMPWWWEGKPVKCWVGGEDAVKARIKWTWITAVTPSKKEPYIDEDYDLWEHAEPWFPETKPEKDYYITVKVDDVVQAETKLSDEQRKELGI